MRLNPRKAEIKEQKRTEEIGVVEGKENGFERKFYASRVWIDVVNSSE